MKKNYRQGTSDDLEYLSEAGYAAVNCEPGETDRIRAQVRDRFSSGPGLFMFNILLTLVLLGVSFYAAVAPAYIYPPLPSSDAAIVIATEPQEVIAEPAIETEVGNANTEPPAISGHREITVSAVPEAVADNEALARRQVDLSAILPPAIRDEQVRYSENAPVRFIHDLKVTDYGTLYFRPAGVDLRSGLDATYSGDHRAYDPENQEGQVFLHEMLSEALLRYKEGSYRECLYLISQVSEKNDEDINALFYSAMCHYQLGRFRVALKGFDEILGKQNNTFHQEAEYYKALALYHDGEKSASHELLRSIAAGRGFYSAKAAELLAGREP
jgi:hypothetical protein